MSNDLAGAVAIITGGTSGIDWPLRSPSRAGFSLWRRLAGFQYAPGVQESG